MNTCSFKGIRVNRNTTFRSYILNFITVRVFQKLVSIIQPNQYWAISGLVPLKEKKKKDQKVEKAIQREKSKKSENGQA